MSERITILSNSAKAEMWVDHVTQTKKVSRSYFQKEDAKYLSCLTHALNQLGEFDRVYGDVNLEDIYLPDFIKQFLAPAKIGFAEDWIYPNLKLMIPKKDLQHYAKQYPYDEERVRKIGNCIAQAYKTTATFSKFYDLRTDFVSLAQADIAVKGKVREEGNKLFVPVPVVDEVEAILGQYYFNISAEEMERRYILRDMKFFNEKTVKAGPEKEA